MNNEQLTINNKSTTETALTADLVIATASLPILECYD